jgi:uncharacterized phage-like protein YoqJ
MQLDSKTTACFTGHRPAKLGGYDPNALLRVAVREELTWKIWAAYKLGYRNFISGFAQGLDQEAAELIIRLRGKQPGVRLVAAIPFEGQQRLWNPLDQDYWRHLLSQADKVEYVCDPGFAGWKMHARNEYMVDMSSLVIAAYDGSPGGTKNCLNYARRHGREVWILDALKREEAPRI